MKMKVYDESYKVDVERDGESLFIPFCEIKEGDYVTQPGVYAEDDAHQCEDPDYEGWVFYDWNGCGYFPEDFGAPMKL